MPLVNLDTNIGSSTGSSPQLPQRKRHNCHYFGIGDGRQKVQKLIDQVKVALLAASHESENAALSAAVPPDDGFRV